MPPSWMVYQRHVLFTRQRLPSCFFLLGYCNKAYDISTRAQNDLPSELIQRIQEVEEDSKLLNIIKNVKGYFKKRMFLFRLLLILIFWCVINSKVNQKLFDDAMDR